MSAYDNPTIIQDGEGVSGWATMAQQISQSSVAMVNAFADAASKRYAIAKKEKETDNRLLSGINFEQSKFNAGQITKLEDSGAPEGLIDQAKKILNARLVGGDHIINGEKQSFGLGTVKEEFLLSNKSGELDDKTKNEYMSSILKGEKGIDQFLKWSAKLKTDEQDWKAMQAGGDGSHFAVGTNAKDRRENLMIAALNYSTTPQPIPGMISKKILKTINKGQDTSSYGADVDYTFKLKKSDKRYLDATGEGGYWSHYKEDKDGYITVKVSKNLDDWDGNSINKQSLKEIDSKVAMKPFLSADGSISKKYQLMLTTETDLAKYGSGQKGRERKKSYVDIPAIEKGLKDTIDSQTNEIVTGIFQPGADGSSQAFMRNKYNQEGNIDYVKEVANGTTTVDEVREDIREMVRNNLMSQYGLGFEQVENPSKPGEYMTVAQSDPILGELRQGKLTTEIIEDIKANGGATAQLGELKDGATYYFYQKDSDVNATEAGPTTKTPRKLTGPEKKALGYNNTVDSILNDPKGDMNTLGQIGDKKLEQVKNTSIYRLMGPPDKKGARTKLWEGQLIPGVNNSQYVRGFKNALGLVEGTNFVMPPPDKMQKADPTTKINQTLFQGLSNLQNDESIASLLSTEVAGIDGKLTKLSDIVSKVPGFSITDTWNNQLHIKSPIKNADGAFNKKFSLPLTDKTKKEVQRMLDLTITKLNE